MRTFQCTQCGAPLEWPDGVQSIVCRFCEAQNHLAPAAPEPRFQTFAHGAAPSTGRPRKGAGGPAIAVGSILAAAAIVAVAAGLSTRGKRDRSVAFTAPAIEFPSPANADEPSVSYFDTPAAARKLMTDELGDMRRVREVVLYKNYVALTVQGGANNDELDRHVIYADRRNRGFIKPQPVSFNGKKNGLDAVTFAFSDINFDVIGAVIADAKKRFAGKVETVSHVYVERESRGRQLIIRVYLTDPRRSAFVEYSMAGKMVRLHGD